MPNIHISVNPSLLEYAEKLVKSGDFNSRSEVFNQALRVMKENDFLYKMQIQKLKEELKKGENSLNYNHEETTLNKIFDKAKKSYNSSKL